jgi:hypothetical protein
MWSPQIIDILTFRNKVLRDSGGFHERCGIWKVFMDICAWSKKGRVVTIISGHQDKRRWRRSRKTNDVPRNMLRGYIHLFGEVANVWQLTPGASMI